MTTRQARYGESRAKGGQPGDAPMDLVSLALAGVRSWYLVAPIVIVSMGLAFLLNERTPRQLEANGQVLLVAAEATASGPVRGVSLDAVAGELASIAVQGELLQGDAELTTRARGRALELQVSGSEEEAVVGTFLGASQWLIESVERRQQDAGVPPLERFTLQVPTNSEPTLSSEGSFRMTGVARLEESAALQQNPHGPNEGTVSLLATIANGDDARSAVAAELESGSDYRVTFRARDAAPVLGVNVTATSARSAIATFDVVADLLEVELESLQDRADVPTGARTVIERIAPPQEVEDIGPLIERPVAAVLGLGALLAVLLVLLLEARDRGRLQPTDDELRRGGLLYPPAGISVPSGTLEAAPWGEQRRSDASR